MVIMNLSYRQYEVESKRSITEGYQEITKSSIAFYTRICYLIELAGYANGIKDQVAKTIFLNGINREIALNIQSSPYPMNLQEKIDYAHRYWIVQNPGQELAQLTLPKRLQEAIMPQMSNLTLQGQNSIPQQ